MKMRTVAALFLLVGTFGVLYFINSLTFKIQKAVVGKKCKVCAAVISKQYEWEFNNDKAPLMSVLNILLHLES